jgi:hypothetical protein
VKRATAGPPAAAASAGPPAAAGGGDGSGVSGDPVGGSGGSSGSAGGGSGSAGGGSGSGSAGGGGGSTIDGTSVSHKQAHVVAPQASEDHAAQPKAAKGTVDALFRAFAAAGVGGGHADGARKRPADEQPKPDPQPKVAKKNPVASLFQAHADKKNAAAVGGGATGSGVGSSSGRAGGGHVDANY